MADLLIKSNDDKFRLNVFQNKNGEKTTIDGVAFNIDNSKFLFPKLDKCILNLDKLTWAGGNEVFNSSSFINPETNRIKVFDGDVETNFGLINDNQTDVGATHNFYINRAEKFLARGSNKKQNKIVLQDKDILDGDKSFTVSTTFNIVNYVSQWVRIFKLVSNENIRVEAAATNGKDYVFASSISSNIWFSFPSWSRSTWFNITLICDYQNKKFKIYKNGEYVSETNITGQISTQSIKQIQFLSDETGCNGKLRSLRVFQDILNQEDIQKLCKIDGLI